MSRPWDYAEDAVLLGMHENFMPQGKILAEMTHRDRSAAETLARLDFLTKQERDRDADADEKTSAE